MNGHAETGFPYCTTVTAIEINTFKIKTHQSSDVLSHTVAGELTIQFERSAQLCARFSTDGNPMKHFDGTNTLRDPDEESTG